MSDVTPVRITLSRQKGFSLQAQSRALNGLRCVKVARPSKWGNPFRITANRSNDEAVMQYRAHVLRCVSLGGALDQLKGKNLACWCRAGEPCHADVLLALANPTPAALRQAEGGAKENDDAR